MPQGWFRPTARSPVTASHIETPQPFHKSVGMAGKQRVPECAGMCMESLRQTDGACETSWCENGGEPIVGHALLEGINLDSAGDKCVVIKPEEL